jgi:hypothetical protein
MRCQTRFMTGALSCAVALAVACGLILSGAAHGSTRSRPDVTRSRARADYGRLALSFAANRGQAAARFRYLESGPGLSVGLGDGTVMLALTHRAHSAQQTVGLALQTPGGHLGRPVASAELPGKANYFLSGDRTRWVRNAVTFAQVSYPHVWPGVGVSFDGHQGVLEYDIHLSAGAEVKRVALAFAGARDIRATAGGGAILTVAGGHLELNAPHASQHGRAVLSRLIVAHGQVRFRLGVYDHRQPLLIDPNLSYATYLGGGTDEDSGEAIAVDGSGDAYVTGYSTGSSFPTTPGAAQTTYGGGGEHAFVTELNPSGSALLYSTYLGGSGDDEGNAIAVDTSGDAYVTGSTSGSFPTTTGAEQTSFDGFGSEMDAFVTKLNPSGDTLLYSTYLGSRAHDYGDGIAVDSSGDAYVTGYTDGSFPTTSGAAQTTYGGGDDAFVTELNPGGSALLYSTYLGGRSDDYGFAVALDSSGDAYVTGSTGGSFPTTTAARQTTYGGDNDAFVTELNPGGSALVYSTYLGGSGDDAGDGIAIDSSGDAYVTGETSGRFPTTTGAEQTTLSGGEDAFVTKLNPGGSALLYSTYLGGSGDNYGFGVAVDSSGDAWVTGQTDGGFPTTTGAEQTTYGHTDSDGFVTQLNPSGSALAYSTYLGGNSFSRGLAIAVDSSGDAYVTGFTENRGFPTTAGAAQTTYDTKSLGDAFVAQVIPGATTTTTGTTTTTTTTSPKPQVEQVSCKTVTVAVKPRLEHRTTCSTTLISGSATLKITGTEHASLSRGRTTDATGTTSQHGHTQEDTLRSAKPARPATTPYRSSKVTP